MKKHLFSILLAAEGADGGDAKPNVSEDRWKSIRKKLEKMNNTELEKVLHEATEAARENPEDESAQAALALVEEVLMNPKQTIKARARIGLMIDGKNINKSQELMLTPQQYAAHACNLEKLN